MVERFKRTKDSFVNKNRNISSKDYISLCYKQITINPSLQTRGSLVNFQPISELSPRTAKIFSSAKPDFPTEKHKSCRFILFSFLRFFNRTKLSQTNEKKINLLFVSQCFSVVFDLSESLKTDNDSFTFHSRSKL